jgi:hypothetical protein
MENLGIVRRKVFGSGGRYGSCTQRRRCNSARHEVPCITLDGAAEWKHPGAWFQFLDRFKTLSR